jgi:hypothetical protein
MCEYKGNLSKGYEDEITKTLDFRTSINLDEPKVAREKNYDLLMRV